jgi:hypothetical protein
VRIVKLNEDSSWLWELDGYILLVDPWLTPSQIDFHRFFSEQFHLTDQPTVESLGHIDVIFISHPFSDHCNKETLLRFGRDLPIISRPGILRKIARWNHFHHLIPLEQAPVKISVLKPDTLLDPVHFAYFIETTKGSLLYAPHGTNRKILPKTDLLITTTTTFKLPFWLGGTINLGYKKALRAKNLSGAQVLVATHDEEKKGKGLIEKLAVKKYEGMPEEIKVLQQGESYVFCK